MSKICLKHSKDLGIIPRSLLLIEKYKNFAIQIAKYKKLENDHSK